MANPARFAERLDSIRVKWDVRTLVGVIVVAVFLAGPLRTGAAQESKATCLTCHSAVKEQLAASVHRVLRCGECHRGEESYPVPPEQASSLGRGTGAAGRTFDHGSSFTGKPARKDIPILCGECHADVERMNPYGLRTDQLAQYRTSRHGKALFGCGDERVAVCTDCHGSPHGVLAAGDPRSQIHPLNVPATCAACHEKPSVMGAYDLPTEVVDEYRRSVHGHLLLEQKDTGAPTCATCHGNHSAAPPGFATVGAVCGRCHEHDAKHFGSSVHASEADFRGCVQCHGGGAGRHFHLIERISKPTGVMIQRYAHLLASEPKPTPERITQAIHPDPKEIIQRALPTCTACHAEGEKDESLAKLFTLLDEIAAAERKYVKTAARLDAVGQGVLLVDNPRFKFEDAKTHLIALAPVQHALDPATVRGKVAELMAVCDQVNAELDELERGLRWRYQSLLPLGFFALGFSVLCYVKFKQLKARHVQPAEAAGGRDLASVPPAEPGLTRRGVLDGLIALALAIAGAALAVPALLYLWPAARGGKSASVEVKGAAGLRPGESLLVQVAGKAVIVVRGPAGYRAFSAVCTHLGCLVKWDGPGRQFKCPCHAAVFDENGHVVSGPPPAPLPEYVVKEIGDQVLVSAA